MTSGTSKEELLNFIKEALSKSQSFKSVFLNGLTGSFLMCLGGLMCPSCEKDLLKYIDLRHLADSIIPVNLNWPSIQYRLY